MQLCPPSSSRGAVSFHHDRNAPVPLGSPPRFAHRVLTCRGGGDSDTEQDVHPEPPTPACARLCKARRTPWSGSHRSPETQAGQRHGSRDTWAEGGPAGRGLRKRRARRTPGPRTLLRILTRW